MKVLLANHTQELSKLAFQIRNEGLVLFRKDDHSIDETQDEGLTFILLSFTLWIP